jgi:F-type H+-transporting ATPase subunit gamma
MPSLRDIKRRIRSVQNTQKITQAMRLVAAAKVKKAEAKVKASRPFSNELAKSFERLLASKPNIHNVIIKTEKAITNYPALLKQRELKTVGILVVTSDRGLAGAYNANVVRRTIARIQELKRNNINVKLFIIGSKGLAALKKENVDIAENYVKMPAIPTAGAANIVAEDIAEYYVKEEIDRIEIITTHFKSMLSFDVQLWEILPVVIEPEIKREEEIVHRAEMLFEPNPELILQNIVPLYLSNRVYQAMTEASASELAARMTAMSSATNNANDMIQYLTLVYNKARQASITQEILEVVSGAQAQSI